MSRSEEKEASEIIIATVSNHDGIKLPEVIKTLFNNDVKALSHIKEFLPELSKAYILVDKHLSDPDLVKERKELMIESQSIHKGFWKLLLTSSNAMVQIKEIVDIFFIHVKEHKQNKKLVSKLEKENSALLTIEIDNCMRVLSRWSETRSLMLKQGNDWHKFVADAKEVSNKWRKLEPKNVSNVESEQSAGIWTKLKAGIQAVTAAVTKFCTIYSESGLLMEFIVVPEVSLYVTSVAFLGAGYSGIRAYRSAMGNSTDERTSAAIAKKKTKEQDVSDIMDTIAIHSGKINAAWQVLVKNQHSTKIKKHKKSVENKYKYIKSDEFKDNNVVEAKLEGIDKALQKIYLAMKKWNKEYKKCNSVILNTYKMIVDSTQTAKFVKQKS